MSVHTTMYIRWLAGLEDAKRRTRNCGIDRLGEKVDVHGVDVIWVGRLMWSDPTPTIQPIKEDGGNNGQASSKQPEDILRSISILDSQLLPYCSPIERMKYLRLPNHCPFSLLLGTWRVAGGMYIHTLLQYGVCTAHFGREGCLASRGSLVSAKPAQRVKDAVRLLNGRPSSPGHLSTHH